MKGFAVALARRHVRAQPSLRIPDRLWLGRWRNRLFDTTPSGNGTGCRKKPSFVLGLGQDHSNRVVRPRFRGSLQQPGTKLRGTVLIRVEQDEDAAVRTGPKCCERDRALQFSRFQDLVAFDADRSGHFHHEVGGRPFGDPSKQDWNCVDFPVTLDNGCDSTHGSGFWPEEFEAVRIQVRQDGIGIELVHPKKLARRVEVTPKGGASGAVQRPDSAFAVFGHYGKD